MGSSNSKRSDSKFYIKKRGSKKEKDESSNDLFRLEDLEANILQNNQHEIKIVESNDGKTVTVQYGAENGVAEHLLSVFENIQCAFEFFESYDIPAPLTDDVNVVVLKFIVKNRSFYLPNSSELLKTSKNCQNKAVVIEIKTEFGDIISIHWKSKRMGQFLTLKNIDDISAVDKNNLYEFIVKFLTRSLQTKHLGLHDSYTNQQDAKEIEINLLADSNNYNLLLLASKHGKSEIVMILLKLGMNTNLPNNNINAQNLARDHQHYDVILELVQANLMYPDSFDISKCPKTFKEFYKIIESLHEAIRSNNIIKAKEILDLYPNQRYFYNSSNESALKISVQDDSIEMYEFLLSRKIMFGPHEEAEEYFQQLSDINKKAIREIHNKYTQHSPEKHLNILLANSFICHDEQNAHEKIDIVQSAYRNLNSNAFIKILLMIVAASKNFKIIFDFNRESVSVADPTADSYTQGLFYPMGRIYIGAKQLLNETTKNEILASMAHEFCHFATNLTYCNFAKPYKTNDHQSMQEFEKISEHCFSNHGKENIVDMVYDYYPVEVHHAELIVRVVHMMSYYEDQPDKLDLARKHFKPLFDFYEKRVVPDMEEAVTEIENRAVKEDQQKDKKIHKLKKISIAAIICAIIGIIISIILAIILHNPVYKFNELSEHDKDVIRCAVFRYKGVEVRLQDFSSRNLTIYTNLTSNQISKMLSGKVLDLSDPQLAYLNEFIFLEWKNMTKSLKEKLLDSNFIFQNNRFKYGEITNNIIVEAFSKKELKDILKGKELQIGNFITNETKFYVRRKFSSGTKEYDFSEVYPNKLKKVFFVLSSDAGTGKTVVFKQLALEIKQKRPTFWVCYLDLKSYTKYYTDNNMSKGVLYILKEILGLKTKFERLFFTGMFNKGLIVFLWNGFDEVSIEYIEFLYKLFVEIYIHSSNSQLICTRPIRTKIFEKESAFSKEIYKSVPLNESEQREYLRKLFISKNITENNLDHYVEKVYSLLQSLESKSSSNNNFGDLRIPLVLNMIGELFSSDVNAINSDNIYKIYDEFALKKIEIWKKKSEFASAFFTDLIRNREFNILKLYQKYSLIKESSVLPDYTQDVIKELSIMNLEIPLGLTNDEIARMGILYIDSNNQIHFVHKTFAEFFSAQYIIDNIYNGGDMSYEEAEFRLEIFFKFILDDEEKIITEFIKSYLQIAHTNYRVTNYPKMISKILVTKYEKLFINLLRTKKIHIIEFLCSFFKKRF